MKLSVVIPTYKNKAMMLKNLKHNLSFLTDCEIIIVNDFPAQSLKEDLKEFKQVILLENQMNLGFGETVNKGVQKASTEHVMLLNTDVVLTDKSYEKAFQHFKNEPSLFAVSFAQKEKNGTIVGKNRIYWEKGFFQHSKADTMEFGINAWAEGGSCIVNTQKFLELKGFDAIYAPFYWEDIDLSYRAWKKGYKILFDPEILVEHHHESTIGKYFDGKKVESIAFRNQLLFIWKNIQDPIFSATHQKYFMWFCIKLLLHRKWHYFKGIGTALKRSSLLKKVNQKEYKRTDQEVITIFS